MNKVTVRTNWQYRPLAYIWELSENDQGFLKREYDWIDDSDMTSWSEELFFRYKGDWYSISDFTDIRNPTWGISNPPEWMKKWDAWLNDSYFSGIVIALHPEDPDYIRVGTFYS